MEWWCWLPEECNVLPRIRSSDCFAAVQSDADPATVATPSIGHHTAHVSHARRSAANQIEASIASWSWRQYKWAETQFIYASQSEASFTPHFKHISHRCWRPKGREDMRTQSYFPNNWLLARVILFHFPTITIHLNSELPNTVIGKRKVKFLTDFPQRNQMRIQSVI